jgi:hypothetical protein
VGAWPSVLIVAAATAAATWALADARTTVPPGLHPARPPATTE